MIPVQFDADTHTYRSAGRVLPSVTTILSPLQDWSRVDPVRLADAAHLGSCVHRMIELDVLRLLDVDALDATLRPYFDAWRDFLRVTRFNPMLSEQPLASERYSYAGTPDLYGTLGAAHLLLDIKTGAIPRTAPLQLAAYLQLGVENELFRRTAERRVLHMPGGEWRLSDPYTGSDDLHVFLAQRTVFNRFPPENRT